MFRVCGVTYTHTSNYGSCLQAYALQTVIENAIAGNGEKCSYSVVPMGKILRKRKTGLKNRIRGLVANPIHNHYRKPFVRFEKEFMHFTDQTTVSELSSLNAETDAFVCGSDVVWNPKYNGGLGAFYLDFAEKYRFAYAASFGGAEYEGALAERAKEYISRFASISVREEQGIKAIEQLGIDASSVQVAADPVLLLERDVWDSLAEPDNQSGKYILVYNVGSRPILNSFVQKMKAETGLKVINVAANANAAFKQRVRQVPTPQRWLQLVRDAEYVVTNSFHGTVFSLIFRKKFFVPVNGELFGSFNVRMYSVLSRTGLQDRMFNAIPNEIDMSCPEYSSVDLALEELRTESLRFIQENLACAGRVKEQTAGREETEN